MIKLQFPPKEIPLVIHSAIKWPKHSPSKNNNIYVEVERRDLIIKKLYEQFVTKFTIGDDVYFRSAPERDVMVVANCAKTYTELGKNEVWPDDDMPLIVSVYNRKTKTTYHCTINAIEKSV